MPNWRRWARVMGELVTGWKEDRARWSARDSIVVSDRLLQVIVLFCFIFLFFVFFSFWWTTVPSKRIIYAHRDRASIYPRSPDHRMNFAIPAAFEGELPSHSACILSPCQVTMGNITECKVMFDITHYRWTTSIGNNSMMCVYGEIRVPFGGRMIAVAQQSCE